MPQIEHPVIALLVSQIDDLERKANAFRQSVNHLCEKEGIPPMYPSGGGGGSGGSRENSTESPPDGHGVPSQIKPDTFYGKKQQTAVREYLVIRRAAGDGPAKPGEILDGLRVGGYQVEAKSDEIALVGLRAMLRKASTVFHKLPNGSWGLKEWYPNAKPAKEAAADKASSATKDTAQPPHADTAKPPEEEPLQEMAG